MKSCDDKVCVVKVGARASLLSKIQVMEVELMMKKIHPAIFFSPSWIQTQGDLDQKTSLYNLENTDFFTKELDSMLLNEKVDICIHSAKDLPHPLTKGLKQIALTKGIDPSDSIVIGANKTIQTMPKNPRIGTSSKRREKAVQNIFPDANIVDIRGNIQERLFLLLENKLDGAVIAEAALIRLGLTHLNRIPLDIISPLHQGKLAILAKDDNVQMERLFQYL